MKILYFTATGNSLHVAKKLGGELLSIPQLIKDNVWEIEADKIGIVFPKYTYAIPEPVEEFLNKVTFKSPYIFSIITCGTSSVGAASELEKIAQRKGFKFSYINHIAMVHNMLTVLDMQKEIEKEPSKNIVSNLSQIVEDIQNKKSYIIENSIVEKFITKQLKKHKSFVEKIAKMNNFDQKFYIKSDCNGCGTCQKVCPINNIEMSNGKPNYQGNCVWCMACIQNCPQVAIHLPSEKSDARYRHAQVTLKEIISANNV